MEHIKNKKHRRESHGSARRPEDRAMFSVVLPTYNAAGSLPLTLAGLLDANRQGLIADVTVSDGGSSDDTVEIAEAAGARVVLSPRGRGAQLAAGAAEAKGAWLLFLHADTRLSADWVDAAVMHAETAFDRRAAVFRLAFAENGWRPDLVAFGGNLRARLLGLPYGDQGLLISRPHYDRLGGYRKDLPLFEDIDLVRRIVRTGGRRALSILPAVAATSAVRYEREGYTRRVVGNARLLIAYLSGTDPAVLAERYHVRRRPEAPRSHGKAAADGAGEDPPRG